MDDQIQYINWLKGLAERGGQGRVDNVDARALGRIAKEIESLRKSIIRAYNNGYLSGHHDTVEGVFTDIHQCDISTYHSDIVEEANWFKNKDD